MTLQHIQTAISTGIPPTMSVEDAAQLLGISRTTAYTEAARYRATDGRHGLPNVRVGGRVLVLTALVLELVRAAPTISHSELMRSSTADLTPESPGDPVAL
jgi:hypothetical protein